MNIWGFSKEIFSMMDNELKDFLEENKENIHNNELHLPYVVDQLISKDMITIKILRTTEKWYGVTYKQDKPGVVKALQELTNQGVYPEKLWE